MSTPRLLRSRARIAVLGLVLWPLVSCGGDSADPPTLDPSRSLTVTSSVTATLPSPTRSVDLPDRPTPSPARTPTATRETALTSSPTPSDVTEAQSPPANPAGPPPPGSSPAPSAEEDKADDVTGPPSWMWWLLGGVALTLAIGTPLLVRGRRRSAWRGSLAEAEADVAWFARELVPELRRSASLERLAGGWSVASRRVVGLEDLLTSLVTTAPDDSGRERALALRDAVRAGRARLDAPAAAEVAPELALDLDDVAATLEAALRPDQI